MRTLTGKTALVTGGTSGIGSEIVAALRARDINIVTCGRREGAGDHAEHDRNGVVYVKADVGSERDVTHLVEAALERFGGIDFLVNNAGTEGDVAPPGDYPVETFDRVIRTNLRGPFLMLRHALPHLLESGGVVVNIASFVGTVVPVPIASAYGASKAGVLSLTASTAAAYGESGLRIFSVAPWITDTPMMDRVSGGDEGALEQLVALNPSGTIARAEDVAGVVVSLLAEPEAHISGSAVLVDAGGATHSLAFPIPVPA